MQRIPVAVSIFTVLFFIFSLTGNAFIADPAFSSMAFADDKDKNKKEKEDKEKDPLRGNKRLREAVRVLQGQAIDIQNQVTGNDADIATAKTTADDATIAAATAQAKADKAEGDAAIAQATSSDATAAATAAQATADIAKSDAATADGKAMNALNSITVLQQKDVDLQNQISTIELTPGPQGIQGIQGERGLSGANGTNGSNGQDGESGKDGLDGVGDIKVVSVPVTPPVDGFEPSTDYVTSSPCTAPDMVIGSGILQNTNTATRIEASVTKIDSTNQTVEFRVFRHDVNVDPGDIINHPVVFFVKCATPSAIATADPVLPPDPVVQQSIVFVTKASFAGVSSGNLPASGHTACRDEAIAAGLPGEYRAWISTSVSSPSNEPGYNNPDGYIRVDGQMIAANYGALSGPLDNPIELHADGTSYQAGAAWTSTLPSGLLWVQGPDLACANWRSDHQGPNLKGGLGLTLSTGTGKWTAGYRALCEKSFPVYCFQQQ